MPKASTKIKVRERTKDYVTVNDRDGIHEQDVEITPAANDEIWKAIGKFVDLSAASSIVAVIGKPSVPFSGPGRRSPPPIPPPADLIVKNG